MVVLVLVALGLGLAWMIGSLVLRTFAWLLVATMALSIVAHIEIPPGIPFLAVGCWLAGHALFRLKHRYWRSRLLQRLADRHMVPVDSMVEFPD
jgi:hypothetical protein